MTVRMMTLSCQAGHTWQRPSQRGKPPLNCPEHIPAPRKVAVRVRPETVTTEPDAPEWWEEFGDVVCWVDENYVEPIVRTAEEERARVKALADKRIDELELMLKSRGTHISQN